MISWRFLGLFLYFTVWISGCSKECEPGEVSKKKGMSNECVATATEDASEPLPSDLPIPDTNDSNVPPTDVPHDDISNSVGGISEDPISASDCLVKKNFYRYTAAGDGTYIRDSELACTPSAGFGPLSDKDYKLSLVKLKSGLTISETVLMGGVMYFAADDGVHGRELWKSDGTSEGTVLVKDINPGSASGLPDYGIALFHVVGSTLFFSADDGSHGVELWKSDGTTAGTVLVKDINASGDAGMFEFLSIGSTLYLFATNYYPDSDLYTYELWKSDGTAAGTVFVKTTNFPATLPTVMGSNLYFAGKDDTRGTELWKSNGTTAGTDYLKDVASGTTSGVGAGFHTVGNIVYFIGNDGTGTTGFELWKTDGTSAGTSLLKDIVAGSQSPNFYSYATIGSTFYLAIGSVDMDSVALWKSNGTTAGTVAVSSTIVTDYMSDLIAVGTSLYFRTEASECKLWKSDGTMAGTAVVTTLSDCNLEDHATLDGFTYFNASTDSTGYELWKTDGTSAGTVMVQDLAPGTSGSTPSRITALGPYILINADDGTGKSLYRTQQVLYKAFAVAKSNINLESNMASIGDMSYYLASEPGSSDPSAIALWKTDGTSDGTIKVKDVAFSSMSTPVFYIVAMGSKLYFVGNDGSNGYELWTSDGTSDGTAMLKDIYPGNSDSNPAYLTVIGSTLYFTAQDDSHGQELWKSDGTNAGTVLVKDINPSASSYVHDITALGSHVYFSASDGTNGFELWKSDGTTAGTFMLKDISTGAGSSDPSYLAVMGSSIYFRAETATYGAELWKSDGTSAGTVLVKDIKAGSGGSYAQNIAAMGSFIYFSADNGSNSYELWKSDGTTAGTVLLKDINVSGGSNPHNFALVGSTLFFGADDGSHGTELWQTDGTSSGTVLAKDIYLGAFSGYPSHVSATTSYLFFGALDGTSYNLYSTQNAFYTP